MTLTPTEKNTLVTLVNLIGERDMPSNNTEARLVERSGFDEETVAWGLSVLFIEGKGCLDYDEHPQTGERGYVLNDGFKRGKWVDKLYAAWWGRPKSVKGKGGRILLTRDPENPEDEWSEIDLDEED